MYEQSLLWCVNFLCHVQMINNNANKTIVIIDNFSLLSLLCLRPWIISYFIVILLGLTHLADERRFKSWTTSWAGTICSESIELTNWSVSIAMLQNANQLNPFVDFPLLIQAEQDLRVAQSEFDRQQEITKLLLEGLNSTQANHLRHLHAFVESQVRYYSQCNKIMHDLQKELARWVEKKINFDGAYNRC